MLMRTTTQCADSQNRFLAHLNREDAVLLNSSLERIAIEPGTLLIVAGAPLDTIYFPETLVVSIGWQCAEGRHVETAVVGHEGVIGWSAFPGAERAAYDAVSQMDGGTARYASRQDILQACRASPTLLTAFLRFADVMAVQTCQAFMSLLRDTVEQRVCRWLLMRHDRLRTDQLLVRHDEISGNLGIRRASVTDTLHVLEGERLIRCQRGRIIIRNRPGLEQVAGGSYGAAEAYHREYLGPFGRSAPQKVSTGPALEPGEKRNSQPPKPESDLRRDPYAASSG